ncbi:MAG: rod shape-determining protein MreD [Lysobacter sp.]|nr:rod shape-determining protein MreD [Lysobacter sp.]
MSRARRPWLFPVTVFVALLLGLLPLPAAVAPLRPYWLALVLTYWLLEDHERVGLVSAFVLGLVADIAFGSLLGEQALRLTVLTFILQRFRPQLRFFPMAQQAFAIGGLLLNDLVIASVIHFVMGRPFDGWLHWWTPVIGAALWPPLFVLLDGLRVGRKH